jgi:hypothetical protein
MMITKAQAAIKIYGEGARDKESFRKEFMAMYPDFPRSTDGYFSDAFRFHNPGQKQAKVKVVKEPKVAVKATKAPKVSSKTSEKKTPENAVSVKSPEEIEAIKAANLARLKEVSVKNKNKPTKVAALEGPAPADFDPEVARAEVKDMLEGQIPSWEAPESLTADEVRALV